MAATWNVSVQTCSANTARIVFAPPGVAVGPTFAVQDMAFDDVTIPDSGEMDVCNDRVRIHIADDGRPPHPDNLRIKWTCRGEQRAWRPGDVDDQNLGAAFVALDNLWRDYIPEGVHHADPMVGFDQHFWNIQVLTLEFELAHQAKYGKFFDWQVRNEEVRRLLRGQSPTAFDQWPRRVINALERVRKSPPGFFTRCGLTLFRDDTWPWDAKRQWISPKPEPQPVVLYVIHHDCDWKLLCRELTALLMPIPRIANRFCGVWFSNYAPLGQKELKAIADDFERHDLPLDLISVDMDWHGKDWYGYQFNPKLFPDPDAFASWLTDSDLAAPFNVHPLYIPANDPRLDAFRRQSGNQNPVHGADGDWHFYQADCVRVDIHDQQQAHAYFDLFHKPIERGGCSFWWIDGSVRHDDGRDECTFLNHAYRNHLLRQNATLPIVLARTGGLGAHRDAIHFTGDTCVQWEVLAFEVETSIRAAGALQAFVSHDIGGFYHDPTEMTENKPPDDLFVRWVQFGCLSPIMRLHSFDGVREPWRFSQKTLAIVRRFMQLRMRLAAYHSRLLDEAHETGVGPLRPMWFEFDDDAAYECLHQYMLGPSLLVVPVVREDGEVSYWLPKGEWCDVFSNRQEQGPKHIEESIALDTMPVWQRGGQTLELCEPAHRISIALSGPRASVTGGGWAESAER